MLPFFLPWEAAIWMPWAQAGSVPSGQLSTLAHALPVGLLKLFVGVRPQTTPPTRGFQACGLCSGEAQGLGVSQRELWLTTVALGLSRAETILGKLVGSVRQGVPMGTGLADG